MSAYSEALDAAKQQVAKEMAHCFHSREDGVRLAGEGAEEAVTTFLRAMEDRGWKLTPREATQEMQKHRYTDEGIGLPRWQAMWDAAPNPGDEEED